MMRRLRDVGLVIAAAIVASSWAMQARGKATVKRSAAEPVLDARVLGMSESLANYCRSVDPTALAKLQSRIAELAQGADEEQLAELRDSAEYKAAFQAIVEFTAKVDPHNAKKVCAQ